MWQSCLWRSALPQVGVRCYHRRHRTSLVGCSGCTVAYGVLQHSLRPCVCALPQPSEDMAASLGGTFAGSAQVACSTARPTSGGVAGDSRKILPAHTRGEPPEESRNLKQLLFSLKDHNTGAVTCLDADERLQNMELLDDWCVTKLFHESGWASKVQEMDAAVPLYRSVIGEHRILRNMLNRFVSNRAMWQDELVELLQLVLERGGRWKERPYPNGFDSREVEMISGTQSDLSRSAGGNEAVVECGFNWSHSVDAATIWRTLRTMPDGSCFYSYGLQDTLWRFLHYGGTSFDGPKELWHMFVAFHRNTRVSSSAKRPLFSSHDMIIALTETEFQEDTRSVAMVSGTGEAELTENVVNGVSLSWPEGWEPTDKTHAAEREPTVARRRTNSNARHERYLSDAFYMNLIEPREVLAGSNGSPTEHSFQVESEQNRRRGATDVWSWWKGDERNIINPVNGELEDAHLTQLWQLFQSMRVDEIVDVYRIVRGGFDTLKTEVYFDIITRKALLLLFFARDEVRAITPPSVTYERLSSLHNELLFLSSWVSGPVLVKPRPWLPLRPFEELSLQDQLSFSCFGQLHAPHRLHSYSLPSPVATPEELYHQYRQLYPLLGTAGGLSSAEEEKGNQESWAASSPTNLDGRVPRFQWLNELQQMSLRFPFQDTIFFHSEGFPILGTEEQIVHRGSSRRAAEGPSALKPGSMRENSKRRNHFESTEDSPQGDEEAQYFAPENEFSHGGTRLGTGGRASGKRVLEKTSRRRRQAKEVKEASGTKKVRHSQRHHKKRGIGDLTLSTNVGKGTKTELMDMVPKRRGRTKKLKGEADGERKAKGNRVNGDAKAQSRHRSTTPKRERSTKATEDANEVEKEVWYPTPDSGFSGEGTHLALGNEVDEKSGSLEKVSEQQRRRKGGRDGRDSKRGAHRLTSKKEPLKEVTEGKMDDKAELGARTKRRGRPKKMKSMSHAESAV